MRPIPHKLLKLVISGIAGSLTQGALMFIKNYFNILPEFQPYLALQKIFAEITNHAPPHYLAMLASFVNGALVLSYLFGRFYEQLPSKHGLIKGLTFGTIGWLLFNLILFPIFGYGLFVTELGLGIWPSVFSLLMIQTYSLSLAMTYTRLINRKV